MNAKRNQLAYQEAAVRNASAIDLVVMLYDILASDLHGAIEAIEADNIELRSAKVKHGFLVLQQLEGTLKMEEGELATNMSRFYSMLRSQMITAQIQQDAAVLREVIQLLFTVREAWVELSNRLTTSSEPAAAQVTSPVPLPDSEETQTASWKA
jgi:flagellar secretion chaperone FliS